MRRVSERHGHQKGKDGGWIFLRWKWKTRISEVHVLEGRKKKFPDPQTPPWMRPAQGEGFAKKKVGTPQPLVMAAGRQQASRPAPLSPADRALTVSGRCLAPTAGIAGGLLCLPMGHGGVHGTRFSDLQTQRRRRNSTRAHRARFTCVLCKTFAFLTHGAQCGLLQGLGRSTPWAASLRPWAAAWECVSGWARTPPHFTALESSVFRSNTCHGGNNVSDDFP